MSSPVLAAVMVSTLIVVAVVSASAVLVMQGAGLWIEPPRS